MCFPATVAAGTSGGHTREVNKIFVYDNPTFAAGQTTAKLPTTGPTSAWPSFSTTKKKTT